MPCFDFAMCWNFHVLVIPRTGTATCWLCIFTGNGLFWQCLVLALLCAGTFMPWQYIVLALPHAGYAFLLVMACSGNAFFLLSFVLAIPCTGTASCWLCLFAGNTLFWQCQ